MVLWYREHVLTYIKIYNFIKDITNNWIWQHGISFITYIFPNKRCSARVVH